MGKTHGDHIGSFPKEISTPTQAQFFSIMEEQEETLYFIGMTYYQMEGTSSTGRGDGATIGPTSGNWNYFESIAPIEMSLFSQRSVYRHRNDR